MKRMRTIEIITDLQGEHCDHWCPLYCGGLGCMDKKDGKYTYLRKEPGKLQYIRSDICKKSEIRVDNDGE